MKTEKSAHLACRGRLSTVRPCPALVPEEIVQDRKLHRDCRGGQVIHSETGLEERESRQLYDNSHSSDGIEPEAMLHNGSAR